MIQPPTIGRHVSETTDETVSIIATEEVFVSIGELFLQP